MGGGKSKKYSSFNAVLVSSFKQVEIYPGTGVMVDKLAWTYALNSNTVTVFVRHLITAVFPLDTLLVNNLWGTKRTGAGDRLPLDKVKVNAIYSRFSATVLYNEDVLHYYASADKSLLSFCIFLFFLL